MTKCVLVIAALELLGGASLLANDVPLLKNGTDYVFGDESFSVAVDGRGFFKEVRCCGKVVMSADPHDAPFDLNEPSGSVWTKWCDRTTFHGVTRLNNREIRSRVTAGPWQVDFHYIVDAEHRMLGRKMVLDRAVDEEGEYRGAWLDSGVYECGGDGGYIVPFRFPTVCRRASQFKPGHEENSWIASSPVIADDGNGSSVLWAHDWTCPYGEETPCVVTERADGRMHVRYKFSRSCGYVRKHEPQILGDVWCWFCKGDRELTLRNMATWYDAIGQRCVADRPPWIENMKLYCLHPGGTIESRNQDWGGFSSAFERLDRIADLGCTAVWLRPIEDEKPYHPRDYYSFQKGIGTPNDYRRFVQRAHQLGLRVIQDIVPHGGNNCNERAKAHPEWIVRNRDGSELTYWCFDFLSPTWIDYMSRVADFYMREFDLDGLRIDAATGSKVANWTRGVPYARASLSLEQGGLAMQRALRRVVKSVKPDAANLVETQSSIYTTTSDSIYDVDLAYKVLPYFTTQTPKKAVDELRRWLHEQSFAHVPGTVPMRYVESHDSRRSVPSYGERPQHAMFAVTALIPGVVMVNQELEDGRFETIRDILRLRARVPEVDVGAADYLAVKAPDGVFACSRSHRGRTSIVLINFNSYEVADNIDLSRVKADATVLRDVATSECICVENGSAAVSIDSYGYRVLRIDDGISLPDEKAKTTSFAGAPACRVLSHTANRLVLAVDRADAWFARAAEGLLESPFYVRHPECDGVVGAMLYDPSGGATIFDSRRQPFGVDSDTSQVGFAIDGMSYGWRVPSGVRVRLMERWEKDMGLKVVFEGNELERIPELPSRVDQLGCRSSNVMGDPRIAQCVGGWCYEEGRLKVRFSRTGAIVSVCRKSTDGKWCEVVRDAQIVSRKGYNNHLALHGYEQRYDLEPEICMTRESDGAVAFSFAGRLRGFGRMAKMKRPISYQTTLRFNGDEAFWLSFGCDVEASADPGEVKFQAEFVSPRIVFPSCDWSEGGCVTAGKKREVSAMVRVNEKVR